MDEHSMCFDRESSEDNAVTVTDLPNPVLSHHIKLLGYSDQGGRPDGAQVMVHRGYAYIGHHFSKGFSIIDVRDPTEPKAVAYVAAPPGTWNIHLQVHDEILLVINEKDMFADVAFVDEAKYYQGSVGTVLGISGGDVSQRPWTAGLAVYDISEPTRPRQIGFMPVSGGGTHRLWYTGGRWAYVSALLDGFTDNILLTVDMSDPTNPRVAGQFWLPGMNATAGEMPAWPDGKRFGLHHAIVDGDIAYAAWRAGGLVVIDVADRSAPKLIAHKQWSPPFGGGTHNCLPLPDRDLLVVLDEAEMDRQEDGLKPIWIFDNREKSNPVSISTCPSPRDADYRSHGGKFGPHNLHENRPGSFVSSDFIFATFNNAGVRVFDIRNQYQPCEVAAFVPPAPSRLVDPRPNRDCVVQTSDIFVDKNGLIYATDANAGLYIMEFKG
jgi:hypothetical protein